MRIAWLTPFDNSGGIPRFSRAVVPALHAIEGVEIDLWHPATASRLDAPALTPKVLPDSLEQAVAALEAYDHVVGNLGNHTVNHAAIFDIGRRLRTVVVLHDTVMQGFFVGYANDVRHDPEHYLALMRYVYGPASERFAADGMRPDRSPEWWAQAGRRYPLVEPCLFGARATVTHSRDALDLVTARYGDLLPTAVLDLPSSVVDIEASRRDAMDREELGLPRDKVLFLVAGRLGPTKRAEVVLRALAADPVLRRDGLLVVAGGGDSDHLAFLRRVAGELGIEGEVRFVPDPDDRTMHSLLVVADVCVTLRNPSTESASAALTEQLHFGKPVVVTRIGLYDRLPDDVVLKTDPDDEEASVSAALVALAGDHELRASYGRAATAWAESHLSPRAYAAGLVAFLHSLPERGAALDRVDAAAVSLADVAVDAPADDVRARASEIAGRLASA
jgi:glycosyltransferase involved in cell wall biosynthesis